MSAAPKSLAFMGRNLPDRGACPAPEAVRRPSMQTMQALVAHAIGEPAEVLRLETRPIPEPAPGQVRIRVEAAPVHASDLHILRGRYGFAPTLPTVLGLESVGVVDALGEGVEGVARGQRVVTL